MVSLSPTHCAIGGSICLDGQVVQHPKEADFILCHGTEALAQPNGAEPMPMSLEAMKQMLQACMEQSKTMPMLVANPDVVTVSGDSLIPMPGTLAEFYAGLGGQVSTAASAAVCCFCCCCRQ